MNIYISQTDINFVPVIEKDTKVVSVFLANGSKEFHNFRCNFCGRIVFQYSGDLVSLLDGAIIPEKKPTMDALCHLCKVKYRVFVV